MLRDHFHSPLKEQINWRSVHHAWATTLAFDLNHQLPDGWLAAPSVEFGIEIEVAAYETPESVTRTRNAPVRPLETRTWEDGQPSLTLDFPLRSDEISIDVYDTSEGRRLAGGIELVSPANKDRQDSRDAFLSKCDWKLREGIGLVVVDLVTNRFANLHEMLLARIGHDRGHVGAQLYAAAYRTHERDEHVVLDVWHRPLTVGEPLPVLSLYLKNGPRLQVDLHSTYERTCHELFIPDSHNSQTTST